MKRGNFMNRKLSATCKQLMLGVIVINLLFVLVGGFISYKTTGNEVSFILGILLGCIIALIMVWHMDYSVENAMEFNEEGAKKYARKMSMIRLGVMFATLLIALTFSQVFHIVGVLLGIMALKFSAYIQPVTSKYIFKN